MSLLAETVYTMYDYIQPTGLREFWASFTIWNVTRKGKSLYPMYIDHILTHSWSFLDCQWESLNWDFWAMLWQVNEYIHQLCIDYLMLFFTSILQIARRLLGSNLVTYHGWNRYVTYLIIWNEILLLLDLSILRPGTISHSIEKWTEQEQF